MKPHKMDERLERIAENMKDLPIKGTKEMLLHHRAKRRNR
jgi:hypothetical protein